jgi:hypothetical protein
VVTTGLIGHSLPRLGRGHRRSRPRTRPIAARASARGAPATRKLARIAADVDRTECIARDTAYPAEVDGPATA